MTYSNDLTQIRSGMVNFIGSMLKTMKHSQKANKQSVASVLVEEAIKLSQDEDGAYDLYVLKPLFRGQILVFKQRCQILSELPKSEPVKSQIEEYQRAIRTLENLVNVLIEHK